MSSCFEHLSLISRARVRSPAAGMPTDNPLARMWGKLTAPEPPPEPAPTTGADYERERDERVARNRAYCERARNKQSRLHDGPPRRRLQAQENGRVRQTQAERGARGPAPTSAPTRRSTRSTRHTGSFFDDVDADALRATIGERAGAARVVASSEFETHEDAREEDETFDDSGVLRYVAWGSADDGKRSVAGTIVIIIIIAPTPRSATGRLGWIRRTARAFRRRRVQEGLLLRRRPRRLTGGGGRRRKMRGVRRVPS